MKTRPLRARLREATALAILDATEQVLAQEGMASAPVQTIAEHAGVAVGTLYNHFTDRQGLIAALFARRREELFDAVDAAAKQHAGEAFEVQLEAFVRAVLAHFDARRDFLRVALENEHARPQVVTGEDGRKRPSMQQLQDRAERIVRIGLRDKRLREEGADLFAIALVSIVKGVLVARSQDKRPFADEAPRVVALFLNGAAR
jgi:AcrR family transcriptional regulator